MAIVSWWTENIAPNAPAVSVVHLYMLSCHDYTLAWVSMVVERGKMQIVSEHFMAILSIIKFSQTYNDLALQKIGMTYNLKRRK